MTNKPKTARMKAEEFISALIEASPNIHASGSIRGMIKNFGWSKRDTLLRHRGYIYNITHGAENMKLTGSLDTAIESAQNALGEECQ